MAGASLLESLWPFSFDIMEMSANWEPHGYNLAATDASATALTMHLKERVSHVHQQLTPCRINFILVIMARWD